jgi:hypothetical protein
MRSGIFLMILALLGALAAGPVLAQPQREPGVLPLDRILPGIRRDHPGQFFDADGPTPGPGGSMHYHLKWMTPDGRIEWLDADARTGRVLGASPGRDSFDGPGPGAYFAPAPSFPMPYGFVERRASRGPDYRGSGPWRGGGGRGYGDDRERRHER